MDKKEIRDILLGRIIRVEERLWAAAPADAKFHFHGVKDGAGDVRLFGVTHRSRSYQLAGVEPDDALEEAEPVLNSMGRPMRLESEPEKLACLYAPVWIAPVLLTLEPDEGDLKLTAYTGRSPFIGRFRCRIALWILVQRLSAKVTANGGVVQSADGDDEIEEKKRPAKRENPKENVAPLENAEPLEKGMPKDQAESKGKSTTKWLKKKANPKRLKKKTAPRRLKK